MIIQDQDRNTPEFLYLSLNLAFGLNQNLISRPSITSILILLGA